MQKGGKRGKRRQTHTVDSGSGFDRMIYSGKMEEVIASAQDSICLNMEVEGSIAMNCALTENLFVSTVCVLNRIPCFIVGKPGSSKTLTMQVMASNLQGKQSRRAFWRTFPAVYIFHYQCSPMSTAQGIEHQFDMARRYQNHATDCITVLLLDEVGLAEHSPDMPLKVLHAMLVDPPVAIVGLSNWALDPAKMNRACFLNRTEPSEVDIEVTGNSIVAPTKNSNSSASKDALSWLHPVAEAYHTVYTAQRGRDFFGMRDFYQLVKLIKRELRTNHKYLSSELLAYAICRNFGGKTQLLNKALETFDSVCSADAENSSKKSRKKQSKQKCLVECVPPTLELVVANLEDESARHLMLLTRNGAALPLLLGCSILQEENTTVLVGSEFTDDRSELYLVSQINEVKVAMATGVSSICYSQLSACLLLINLLH